MGEKCMNYKFINTQTTDPILTSIIVINFQYVTSESSNDPIPVFTNPNNNL
jgi:hypothetical protein